MSATNPRSLNAKQCKKALALVEMGLARVSRERDDNGRVVLHLTTASGANIGSPHRNEAYRFDRHVLGKSGPCIAVLNNRPEVSRPHSTRPNFERG